MAEQMSLMQIQAEILRMASCHRYEDMTAWDGEQYEDLIAIASLIEKLNDKIEEKANDAICPYCGEEH